jgi:hypothetical protein
LGLRRFFSSIWPGFLCLLLTGCPPNPPPAAAPYAGPTDPMDRVIAGINANNRKLPSLWDRLYFEATIVDSQKHSSNYVNGEGVLLYLAPRDFRLVGRKELADLFEIGSNDRQFWLKVASPVDTLWWGNYRNLGKPCAAAIPIRPDLLVDVLGIGPIDENLLDSPAPIMRYFNEADQYVIIWSVQTGDRWLASREIWYSRQTLAPTRVVLYDANGRVALRADLSDDRPVPRPDLPKGDWPRVATSFHLYFPDTGTKMYLQLNDKELALSRHGVPSAGGIRLPDLQNPGVGKVIQVDADCGQ